MLKKSKMTAATALLLSSFAFLPDVVTGGLSAVAMAQADLIDGTVTKIDEPARKITINSGPIKKFGMNEGHTMVYLAQDPAMLKKVKVGDKVKFEVDRVNGQFTVTRIEKAS
jgi:Cu(I)/Ag(I) efflux system periplasmic protein CusF